jgi:hypothetical protein
MRAILRLIVLGTLASAASCSTGATSSTPAIQTVDIEQTAKLQLGVGTATIAWGGYTTGSGSGATSSGGGTFIGTNFTATFRAANGHSATLVNTPMLTGPPSFSFGFPTTPNTISGILPNVYNSTVLAATSGKTLQGLPASFGATLGPLVGVFGYGLAADNLLAAQTALGLAKASQLTNGVCPDLGSAGINAQTSPPLSVSLVVVGAGGNASVPDTAQAQSHELGLPLLAGFEGNAYCPGNSLSNLVPTFPATSIGYPVNYYGGPPAWPSAQGYGTPAFFVGYPLGFTDFATPPVAGKYSLDVAYAKNVTSTSYGHIEATATLGDTVPLPPLSITSASVNGDGTISVVLTIPPGLLETIVMVRAQACNSAPNNNFSIVTHSAGTQQLVFAANLGPPDLSGRPTTTICKGLSGIAYAVGFDYPAYESSYPFDVSQTPRITNGDGHTGRADLTTSAPVSFTSAP